MNKIINNSIINKYLQHLRLRFCPSTRPCSSRLLQEFAIIENKFCFSLKKTEL